MGQIINIILRLLVRRGMQWGVRKGVGKLARKPGATGAKPSPELAKAERQNAKRARQAIRLIRRIGR